MDETARFEGERRRLLGLATQLLGDRGEAEDVVQQAWLRMHRAQGTDAAGDEIENLPGWLTTVTTRLCLDRLRARTPVPEADPDGEPVGSASHPVDPSEAVALADSVGVALQVVLDRLPPRERVAFVLHDSFGFEFTTIADLLDTTAVAARKLASRARARIGQPQQEDQLARWEVVDAFMAAAREGDFERLLTLLAPDVQVSADDAARLLGTPERIVGAQHTASFFNGSARAALPVLVGDRPGAAWFQRGQARVVFDFDIVDGRVQGITFRAAPEVLAGVARRDGGERRT
jgi:RNA polymerase sigma factor (sigma-70 family)